MAALSLEVTVKILSLEFKQKWRMFHSTLSWILTPYKRICYSYGKIRRSTFQFTSKNISSLNDSERNDHLKGMKNNQNSSVALRFTFCVKLHLLRNLESTFRNYTPRVSEETEKRINRRKFAVYYSNYRNSCNLGGDTNEDKILIVARLGSTPWDIVVSAGQMRGRFSVLIKMP